MLTEVCESFAPGLMWSDDGLSWEPIDENKEMRSARLKMQEGLARLREFLDELKTLGVDTEELAEVHAVERDNWIKFTARDIDVRLACQSAFAVGMWYGFLDGLLDQYLPLLRRYQQSKKKGAAGGKAVSDAAQNRATIIIDAYVKWAGTEENGKPPSNFISAFVAEQKRANKKGFSKESIRRALKALDESVLATWKSLQSCQHRKSHKNRNAIVFKAMQGKPGISAETVRRALS